MNLKDTEIDKIRSTKKYKNCHLILPERKNLHKKNFQFLCVPVSTSENNFDNDLTVEPILRSLPSST